MSQEYKILSISASTNGGITENETTYISTSASSVNFNSISATTFYGSAAGLTGIPTSTFTGGTVSGATNFTNGLTANTFTGDGSGLTNLQVFDNVKIIKQISELPTPSNGFITLSANTLYYFDIDSTLIFSDRLIINNNTFIYGINKTLTTLQYTGSSSFINYNNSNFTLRDIVIKTPNGSVFSGSNTSSFSTYVEQATFNTCNDVGSISGGGVFIKYGVIVGCGDGLTLSSTLGSVIIDTTSFRTLSGSSNSCAISVLSGTTCTSFRVFNSIFDTSSTYFGIKVFSGFTPSSSAILTNNIFTGNGIRLDGVNGNSSGWTINYGSNVGISGLQFTDVDVISTANATFANGAGTYTEAGTVRAYIPTISFYDSLATNMEAKVIGLITSNEATFQIGVRNLTSGTPVGGLQTAVVPGTLGVVESDFITITPNRMYNAYYVKASNTGGNVATRYGIKLRIKTY